MKEEEVLLGEEGPELEEKVRVPGIKTLGEKPLAELASVLANILKSRKSITHLEWDINQDFVVLRYLKQK